MNSISRKILQQHRYLLSNNININRKISNVSEAIIINDNNKNNPLVTLLLQKRLDIKQIYYNKNKENSYLIWLLYNDKMQLDCTSFNINIKDNIE
jgi:hypothetical protein